MHTGVNRSFTDFKIPNKIKPFMLNNILKERGFITYLFSANPYVGKFFNYEFDVHYEIDKISPPIYKIDINTSLKLKTLGISPDNSLTQNMKGSLKLLYKLEIKLLFKILFHVISKINWRFNFIYRFLYKKLKNYPTDKGISHFIKQVDDLSSENPIFLFANFMEVHEPYSEEDISPDEIERNLAFDHEFNTSDVSNYKNNYRKTCDYLFKKLEEFILKLNENKVFEDSLIIILSDHGQLLGEYGRVGHKVFLYDELVKIPLYIKYPKNMKVSTKKTEENITITNIKKFIIDVLETGVANDETLYDEVVYCESHGSMTIIKYNTEKVKDLNKYRIKMVDSNNNYIFNVSDYRFESELTNKKMILKFLQLL
jgi:hypothetical protein